MMKPNQKQKSPKKLKQSFTNIFKNNMYLVKIAWKEAPLYTFDILAQGMSNRIVVFIEHIYMIGFIINSIEMERPFLPVALFICSVLLFLICCNIWSNFLVAKIHPKATEKISKRLRLELYQKATTIDLECYDNPEFYNDFVWAMTDVAERVPLVLRSVSDLLGCIVGIIIVSGYFLSTDKVGLLLALFAFVGIVIIGGRSVKLKFNMETELKPLQRKRDYVNRVMYLNEFAKEIRLSKVKEKLYDDFGETIQGMDKIIRKRTKKLSVYWFILEYFFNFFIFDGIYLIYLLYQTIVRKVFHFGTMVRLYNSCGYLVDILMKFARVLPDFQKHSLYIEKISKFLDYDMKIQSGELAMEEPKCAKTLQLKNVTFSYQESMEPVLKNINLTIHKGEKVAFVGYNGAGKTTLVKLLMRLYDPTSGVISYGNENIQNYNVTEYRNSFATVFQDYQIFAASLAENITMDEVEIDYEKAAQKFNESGFMSKFEKLPLQFKTPLTKEFDDEGVNLSGGETQKVAISRALYQDAPIVILDEPSSALDPIAEYNLNNTMRNLDSEKTVIYISHRLSTTRMADRIYMLENGEIIEEGMHDELVKQQGKYAQMFELQSEKYR
ncbi:ABC transporter ATP-binding protein [Paludicola sp. MB14-C6]|uniref:ABC transporter ATP-binding protein n=1 Tax=Paludihabitans sp. MB14-C6 TaxID=3070656 RepID=UPI0027DC534B|nr:ABC transporter ATP-binding protein [Paludicola sp. MB14-C6]WMJ23743.1 ABC transporter ATP-binding protein [Paludicola sp. MB14-C6]